MKIIRLKGGLGNQLFILNYALFLKKNSESVFIENVSGFFRDSYKRSNSLNKILKKQIIPSLNFLIPLFYIIKFFKKLNDKYSFSIGSLTFIEGYFQDKKYYDPKNFILLRDQLREDVEIFNDIFFYDLKNKIEKENSVIVHLRLKDYDIVDLSYYFNAIGLIKDKINNPRYIIFTDDKQKSFEIVKSLKVKNYIINSNDQITDFKLMTYGLNFILANSTFSLWAAMLSKSKNGTFIIPSEIEILGDIIPENYIKI